MSRISDIFTTASITQQGATVLNPLKTYISTDTGVTDTLTENNIADTVDSLFFMQCGDKTPFTKTLKINYNNTTREFTEETYDCITKMSIGRFSGIGGYYNNPLDWNYNAQGLMARVHDDNNLYSLKGFKRTYPDSCMLGQYPFSNYEYRTPRLSVRVYYINPETAQNANVSSTYTTPYDFINNKSKQGYICNSIMIYYTGFSNPSLMWSQEIKNTDDGTVKTFSIPYSNNVYFHFYQDSALQFSGIDFTNKEYFNERIHVGTAYNHNNYVYPIKPEKILNFIASFGFLFVGEFTANTTQTFYPIVNSGIITGDYAENIADWKSDNSSWENTDNIDRPRRDDAGDEITEMKSNDETSIHGRVKYYQMTDTSLASFISDVESILDDTNVMNNFVCAYHIPLNCEDICIAGAGSHIIIGGHTLSTSAPKVVGCNTVTLASFSVPRRHNNAYDTLTKYYLYTPFTDVIPLNYKCAGHTITVQLHPSVQDVTGVITVKANGMEIYKQSVSIGSSLCIATENNAEKQNAIINSVSKYTGSAMATLGGFMTGNIPAIAGGSLGIIASTSQVVNAVNNSYIHSYGATTGNSLSLLPTGVYLIEYVTRTDEPENFGATVGYLTNKTLTLSENMGFTKLDKPRIDCGLTAPEMSELINMLENGVIL